MFSLNPKLDWALFSENWFFSSLMFSIGCFDEEITESKITLSSVFNLPNFGEIFIFNDLRPIFSRLIFQSANVYIDVKIDVSFFFNGLRHIYIRNKVAILTNPNLERLIMTWYAVLA